MAKNCVTANLGFSEIELAQNSHQFPTADSRYVRRRKLFRHNKRLYQLRGNLADVILQALLLTFRH